MHRDTRGQRSARERPDVTGPKTRSMAGTYAVGGDCRFGLFFPSDLAKVHQALGACVLVDNGKELYCLDVEEGWVATGIGKKI